MSKVKRPAAVPAEVWTWLLARCCMRTPVHCPGEFAKMVASKASCCWHMAGGYPVGSWRVAVCQPSVQSKGDRMVMFYDFVKA